MEVSTGSHKHPILHFVGMGTGTYIPPRGLREGCFVTAGGRKNHSFDLLTGKPLRKQSPSELRRKIRHASPESPAWGPAGALPVFRSRRGGEYPCLQNFRRGVSDRPSSPYPGLGRVTASDTIFPAYVNSLARRFSLSTGVWWSDLCYRHARKARPSSLRL